MIGTLLSVTAALAGSVVGYVLVRRRRSHVAHVTQPTVDDASPASEPVDVAVVTRNFLMWFVMPLWLAAGLADWFCHRGSAIEVTTGVKESLIHLAMLMEAAVPVLMGMFLEISSPVLAIMIAAFGLHDLTALWDVTYANRLREVTPIEQHVHDYLATVPLMAVSFICVLHWPQVLSLFRIGGRKQDWSLRLKKEKLPWGYVTAMMTAMLALEWGPYMEELFRSVPCGTTMETAPRQERHSLMDGVSRPLSRHAVMRRIRRQDAQASRS